MKDKLLVVCTNSQGDRKLYAHLIGGVGDDVWNTKKERYEPFVKGNFEFYTVPLRYNGCDVYILDVPKRSNPVLVVVYTQGGKEPSLYDQILVATREDCVVPKEIPEKIKPQAPLMGHA